MKGNIIHINYTTGDAFEFCTFVKETHPVKSGVRFYRRAVFKCKCGNEFEQYIHCVKSGGRSHCGCMKDLIGKKRRKISGDKLISKTTEYFIWGSMIKRCTNKRCHAYERYGGRGIIVCERWLNSFKDFLEDVGFRPSKDHSLDRFPNNNGNYEPGNFRWATRSEQARNTRSNVFLLYNGEEKCLGEWSKVLNIPYGTIYARYKKGKSTNEILNN